MKKNILAVVSLIMMTNMCILPIHAEETEGNNGAETRAPVCEYIVAYTESTRTNKPYNVVTAIAENLTAITQTVTVTKTRSRTFSGNISGSAERDIVLAKIKITAEVGYGVTNSISVSAALIVPANTTYKVDIGSNLLTTSGTLSTTNKDCSVVKKSSTLKLTTGEYIKWYK